MESLTKRQDLPSDSNAHLVYIPVGVFGVLCPVLVGLRTWARLRKGGKMGSDDWTIIAALIFCLISSGMMVASCHFGFGRHFAFIKPDDKYETMKFFYGCQISYKASINLTKCSILLLFLRVFGRVRWFTMTCWALLIVIAMYCLASVIVTIFQCIPIEKTFDETIPGHCIENSRFWYANAGFSIATDFLIYLIPMPLVYKLQIPTVQKAALILVFAMGGFTIVTSCLRVTTINTISTTPDITYDISSTMWTMIEPNVAVICACLPMIRPLLVRVIPKFRSRKGSSAQQWAGQGNGIESNGTGSTLVREPGDLEDMGSHKKDEYRLERIHTVRSKASQGPLVGDLSRL